jgi:DNA invertase Pin-like site-specific DNA recombinase
MKKPKGPVPEGRHYAYARVSTAGQVEHGHSLEGQKEMLRRYFEFKGWAWDPEACLFVDEGVSAFKAPLTTRPAGGELCGRLRQGDHVVITMLDRAFRRVEDCARLVNRWNRLGVALHIVSAGGQSIDTATSMGWMMVQVLAMLAEWESRIKSERQVVAHANARARKGHTSRAPLGYQWVRVKGALTLVRSDQDREWLARIYDWYLEGWTYQAIYEHLAYRLKVKLYRRLWSGPKGHPIKWCPLTVARWVRAEAAIRQKEAAGGNGYHPDPVPITEESDDD